MTCTTCPYYYDCPLLVRFKSYVDAGQCEWRKVWEGLQW